jgi:hypothetical protein
MSSPDIFVRLISEFVEPGATVTLRLVSDEAAGGEASEEASAENETAPPAGGTWTLRGVGEVEKEGA